jgi:hypothetical protein
VALVTGPCLTLQHRREREGDVGVRREPFLLGRMQIVRMKENREWDTYTILYLLVACRISWRARPLEALLHAYAVHARGN